MKLIDLYEAVSKRYVYHVTFTKNVKNIMSQGLKPFQTSNWSKGPGGDRYNEEGGVFAFEHPEDAFKWAFKQKFAFKKPVSIIKMKRGNTWEVDPSQDISLQMGKGKALRSIAAVKAGDMIEAFDFDDFGTPGDLGISQQDWIKGIIDKLS